MKFRNQFLKYRCHAVVDAEVAAGGGGVAAEEGVENNNEPALPDHSNLWDNESSDEPAQPAHQQQAAAQPLSAAQAFDNHVATLDFNSDPAAMMTAMREGDAEGFAAQLQSMQVGIYKAAMLDANKMMQQTSGNLKTELQQNTDTTISSNKIIGAMNEKLPYTAEPAYAPMAKAVISRLLSKKGMTPERAIKETGDYFSQMANKVGGTMKGNLNRGQQNQFGDDTQDEEMDWVAFMGGKPD